jgi:hypothetical protein
VQFLNDVINALNAFGAEVRLDGVVVVGHGRVNRYVCLYGFFYFIAHKI